MSKGYDRNGKKIVEKKTITLDSSLTPKQIQKELQHQAAEFENAVKKGNIIDSAISFEKFTLKWLTDYAEANLEQTTIESYKRELENKIFPAIGHIKLCELKPLHLIKFYSNLTEDGIRMDGKAGGYSTRIIKYQHQIISSILQTAVYWQAISQNITKNVKVPKGIENRKDENYFDEIQAKSFLEYVMTHEPLEYQAMALVTMYGGLRKGEVLGLEWSDIDFKNNTININKAFCRANKEEFIKSTKNDSSNRTIILPNNVISILRNLKIMSTSLRVFPLCYSVPTQWFKRMIKNHNNTPERDVLLPTNVTFHGLRHTTATLLIAQGLDIKSISSRLGHNNTTTTLNIYSHALKSRDKAAADALESILNIR